MCSVNSKVTRLSVPKCSLSSLTHAGPQSFCHSFISLSVICIVSPEIRCSYFGTSVEYPAIGVARLAAVMIVSSR